jgi:transcriptional regulator with XRE-family HTH domain
VIINADRLRYEMAIRGITAGELARLAGVNKNTITRALTGRPVSRRTLRELSRALLTYPTLRMADVLLEKPQVA